MAIEVHSHALWNGGVRRFDAHTWEVDPEGYLRLMLTSGDPLVEFPPGKWDMVLDMDPYRPEAK